MVFEVILIVATLACSLVAGFLLAFAVVVMPGLRSLDDAGFLRAFQVIDRVIQDRQPVFMLVWVGSLVSLALAAALGLRHLEGAWRLLVSGLAVAALLGVHLPTLVVNIPLNDRLQTLRIEDLGADALRSARRGFESRWNRWNRIRTVVAGLVSLLLIVTVWST